MKVKSLVMVSTILVLAGVFLLSSALAQQNNASSPSLGETASPLTGLQWVKGSPVQMKEGGVYVVEFWATWCPPCRTSIPHLTKIQAEFKDQGVTIIGISDEMMEVFMNYNWPGNVRELENLVERICTINPERTIRLGNLPPLKAIAPIHGQQAPLREATQAFEKQYILSVLEAAQGNKTEAARRLGIHRNTLLTKTKELGIGLS